MVHRRFSFLFKTPSGHFQGRSLLKIPIAGQAPGQGGPGKPRKLQISCREQSRTAHGRTMTHFWTPYRGGWRGQRFLIWEGSMATHARARGSSRGSPTVSPRWKKQLTPLTKTKPSKYCSNAVAEELAVEHCSFYGDKASKAVKGFFLNQVYRSWGHTTHRGWARLLLDRRSLVQVPNGPRRRERYYEENIMKSDFHPEVNHQYEEADQTLVENLFI